MSALIAPDSHRVDQHRAARWGAEGRLKCHRPFNIAAAHFGSTNRVDGPVSRLLVQQSGKDRWPIEAGKAQPVNVTHAVDQRG